LVVKTFFTTESEKRVWVDGKLHTQKYGGYNAKKKDCLPYEPVKATAAFDIWSFGVMFYSLCTGDPLFAVNRDDDLMDATAMMELFEWNKIKLTTKLDKINDPLLAHKTSSRKFSHQIHQNATIIWSCSWHTITLPMLNILQSTLMLHSRVKKMEGMIRKLTVEVKINNTAIIDKINRSTSVTLTASIFEATEVKTTTLPVL
jgi:hypothetical protein